jgi:hypothetical protein
MSRFALPSALFALAALSACTKGGADDTGEVVNEAPSAPVVAIDAGDARTMNDLVASITTESEDPEGDEVTYTWSWTVDGAVAGTEATVVAADTAKGQTWQISVVASDGELDSEAGTAEVTILNTPPVETSVTLSASEVYTNDVLSASTEGEDADGDALTWTYQWFVDGAESDSGESLDGATAFDKGDEIYVVATANDGEADGPGKQSDTVVVLNSLPTAPVVSITPDEPNEGVDDIKCVIDTASEDADEDAISYTASWTVDGAAYTGPTETHDFANDNISGENHFYGEVWECTVWTNDGEADGESATASVVITRPDLTIDGTEETWAEGEYLYDEVSIVNGAVLWTDGKVVIEAGSFVLDATSSINGSSGGAAGGAGSYAAGSGTGAGAASSGEAGAGGGYGGAGGDGGYDTTAAAGGATYGSASSQEIYVGSGGGSGGAPTGAAGGDGGGALVIWAADIDIAGEIFMDGGDAEFDSNYGQGGGGGSGGGVLLVGDTVDVSGLIAADGGAGGMGAESVNDDGGGGGGGRIKVFYDTSYNLSGTYRVAGGAVGTLGTTPPVAGTDGTTSETQQTYVP